jgi:hypothetical protein
MCVICKKRSRNHSEDFKLIRFKLTDEQRAFNLEMKQMGKTGHPRGRDWFCQDHSERAISLKHLTNIEAINIIKSEEEI